MRQTDVAIIGAGVAGSLAATILGRAGYSATLIDPIHPFPADFRCEKIEHAHASALKNAGLFNEVVQAGHRYQDIWIARQGRRVEKRPLVEYGIDYATLVNRLRELFPPNVSFLQDKVLDAQLTDGRQILRLVSGEQVTSCLVIVASGVNPGLLEAFGMERNVISRCHSVSIGFDVASVGRDNFDFNAITYFGEHPRHRVAYLTLFPIGSRKRANLFVYRQLKDPWLKEFRADPVKAMLQCMPKLGHVTGELRVEGAVQVRPVDLVSTENIDQSGVVLVGDAFATACPTTGTGAAKAMVDVERLCNVYVPSWLENTGVDAASISAFYNDAEKTSSDQHSRDSSLFAKRLATEPSLLWTAYRWARCVGAIGRNTVNQGRHVLSNAISRAGHLQR